MNVDVDVDFLLIAQLTSHVLACCFSLAVDACYDHVICSNWSICSTSSSILRGDAVIGRGAIYLGTPLGDLGKVRL